MLMKSSYDFWTDTLTIDLEFDESMVHHACKVEPMSEWAEGESAYMMPEAVLVAADGTLWMRRSSLACDKTNKMLTLRVIRRGDELFIDHPLDPETLYGVVGRSREGLIPVRVSPQ
jgi:hypothetical protein